MPIYRCNVCGNEENRRQHKGKAPSCCGCGMEYVRPGRGIGVEERVLAKYWMENYTDDKSTLCALCANTGFVDTTLTAISPSGARPGGRHPCICPNGRAIRAGLKKAKRVEIEG